MREAVAYSFAVRARSIDSPRCFEKGIAAYDASLDERIDDLSLVVGAGFGKLSRGRVQRNRSVATKVGR